MKWLEFICANPDEEQVMLNWYASHQSEVRRISPNHGCGCCVQIYVFQVDDDVPIPLLAHLVPERSGFYDEDLSGSFSELLADHRLQ